MIGCNTRRPEIPFPLNEFSRHPDPRLPELWRQTGFSPVGRTQALIEIEKFVDKVVASQQPAYGIKPLQNGRHSVWITPLGERLMQVLPLLGIFDSFHDYSEKPYAFLRSCWSVENWLKVDLTMIGSNPRWGDTRFYEELNILIVSIREMAKSDWFNRCVSDRKYESKRRASEINAYVANLLFDFSKLLLVRVDLYFPEEVHLGLTVDRFYEALYRYLWLISWHPYFRHLKGYVWAVEEGIDKGPHAHFLFLFDGSVLCDDITLANMVRGLWDGEATDWTGTSWNCNLYKDRYDDVGIGMIERSDPDACRKAVYFATYLGKDPHHPDEDGPQYLRMKPAGAKVFSTGHGPRSEPIGGRPPKKPVLWTPASFSHLRWPNGLWA